MRERGRYQIQLMKTRSSSGIGSKIDLEFDVDSLRIRDLIEDEEAQKYDKRISQVYNTLKKTSDAPAESVPADPSKGTRVTQSKTETDSSKLREFLTDINKE